jgi:hypothetical protein
MHGRSMGDHPTPLSPHVAVAPVPARDGPAEQARAPLLSTGRAGATAYALSAAS